MAHYYGRQCARRPAARQPRVHHSEAAVVDPGPACLPPPLQHKDTWHMTTCPCPFSPRPSVPTDKSRRRFTAAAPNRAPIRSTAPRTGRRPKSRGSGVFVYRTPSPAPGRRRSCMRRSTAHLGFGHAEGRRSGCAAGVLLVVATCIAWQWQTGAAPVRSRRT
jgi:hypothetical protein